jgi:hypothetical protein
MQWSSLGYYLQNAVIEHGYSNGSKVPHSLSSPLNPCCRPQQRPFFSPRGGMTDFAQAAFFSLRALAAQIHNDWVGLRPDLSCATHQGPLRAECEAKHKSHLFDPCRLI